MLIGHGILNWRRNERITDRYGAIHLSSGDGFFVIFQRQCEGQRGVLYAIVRETRVSSHCGDMLRGIAPSVPDLGEKIVLGSGTLFYNEDITDTSAKISFVGLKPDDGREHDWLDVHSLYKLHEQTVDLYFDPSA